MGKQLSRLTSKDFMLPAAADHRTGRVSTLPAGGIPIVRWPDGKFCFYINLFLLERWENRCSHRTRGGTLGAYTADLSHLIRFCFDERIDFHEVTDEGFHRLIGRLRQIGQPEDSPRRRTDTTVLRIGRLSLDFLYWVSELRQDVTLVGRQGQIRAERREIIWHTTGSGEREARRSTFWFHSSFPEGDALHRRVAISSSAIEELRKAAARSSRNVHQRVRRLALITALEITGGRREEVVNLEVGDVMDVANGLRTDLRLITVKRRGGKTDQRYVPVSRADALFLADYIRVNRASIIRKTIGSKIDHGFVFVSITTGRQLATNTVTQEIYELARLAGLRAVSCPHMFRHRFVTKIFVQLIEQHNIEHKDDLRKLLLSTSNLKLKLLQWTGHKRMSSLDRYIDPAFAEVSHFRSSISKVLQRREIEGIQSALRSMALELETDGGSLKPDRLRTLAELLDTIGLRDVSD